MKKRSEELAEEFLSSLRKIMRGKNAIFRKELEEYGITWPQFHLLKLVKDSKGMSVTELGDTMIVTPPTVSRMIEGLCAKGLLTKAKNSKDRRIAHVQATPEGKALVQKVVSLQRHLMHEVFEAFQEEEIEVLVELFKKAADRWLDIEKKIRAETRRWKDEQNHN